MSLRKIASLTALLSFAALVFSSVLTYLAPRGPGSSQWEMLGLGKHEWFALHTNLGILFLIAGTVHIIVNIKPLVSYLRNKEKKIRVFTLNFNLALLLTVWVAAGSIFNWAPFNSVRDYKESRGSRSRHHPETVDEPAGNPMPEKPPFLYSGQTLERHCKTYGLQPATVVRQLEHVGIQAKADQTIRTIADHNNMEPRSVFDTIRELQEP